jgi:predicted ester cyclase
MPESTALIEDFYFKVWNRGDEDVAREILAPALSFRASTGPVKSGVPEFIDYVRLVRGALSDYECIIEDLVTEGDRAFAKMLFRGRHTGRFFGVEPTGRELAWVGAALFRFSGGRISSIWVLGDVDGLKVQLGLARPTPP